MARRPEVGGEEVKEVIHHFLGGGGGGDEKKAAVMMVDKQPPALLVDAQEAVVVGLEGRIVELRGEGRGGRGGGGLRCGEEVVEDPVVDVVATEMSGERSREVVDDDVWDEEMVDEEGEVVRKGGGAWWVFRWLRLGFDGAGEAGAA